MHNKLFTIGPITVHGYGMMIGIGVIAAYFLAEYRAKKKGLDPEKIFSLTIFCLLFGALGAKILYYITIIDEIIANPIELLNISDGWVVYGGIIGGIFGGWLFCRIKQIDFLRYFDLTMPSIALAQGFGRIGCFLAGCCYGIQTDCPISVTFTNSAFAPNGVALVPTQLISSGLNFIHAGILMYIASKTKKKGVVAACYMIFYSIGRFIIEFYRGDLVRGAIGALSTSQFISLFVLVAGVILLIVRIKRKPKEEILEKFEDEVEVDED